MEGYYSYIVNTYMLQILWARDAEMCVQNCFQVDLAEKAYLQYNKLSYRNIDHHYISQMLQLVYKV